jgi:hypothetical protein
MYPEDDRFCWSLDLGRGPYIPDTLLPVKDWTEGQQCSVAHKNKQFSFSLGGGGVLKIGITTDGGAGAVGNCCKQDGPSLLASTICVLTRATGGSHRW